MYLIMDYISKTFLLFALGLLVCCLAQDESLKSSKDELPKVSSFKAKLAKTELGAKPAALEKIEEEDTVAPIAIGVTVPSDHENDTVIQKDHHTYYNSTFHPDGDSAKQFWINLDELPENHVITHEKLSDSYRQATTVELSFDFPFYGHLVKNVTIATGGFLYMGDYLHNWIAATQYIAPLMANFDTRLSNQSVIKYADTGNSFTVQWEKVCIQNRQSEGAFTFQVRLLNNGDILFGYKDVPYPISSISDSSHPVKVGLSDAYILEKAGLFFSRKTVYEYNRIQITNWEISNNTVIYFTALPTCNRFKDCSSCISSGLKLECNWCETLKRCSDGIDRQRQTWVQNRCAESKTTVCPGSTVTSIDKTEVSVVTNKGTEVSVVTNKGTEVSKSSEKSPKSSSAYKVHENSNEVFDSNEAAAHLVHDENSLKEDSVSAGAIATILIFLAVIVSVSVWIFYAYKNPESSSGQFLIKYRPSQWAMKKESTSVSASNIRHL